MDRARCSSCGTIPEEWLSTYLDGDGNPTALIPPPYEAEARVCGGCEERERFEAAVFTESSPRPHGTHVLLVPPDPKTYIPAAKNGPSLIDADEEG